MQRISWANDVRIALCCPIDILHLSCYTFVVELHPKYLVGFFVVDMCTSAPLPHGNI